MPGYKRKPTSMTKKPKYGNKSKRQYSVNTKPQTSQLKDGTSIVCGSYFEIEAAVNGAQRKVGASVRLDPTTFTIQPLSDCHISDGTGTKLAAGVGSVLPFDRLSIMRQLYSQFRVSSVTVKVTADLNEMQNVICMCSNRALSTPVDSLQLMKAQAHKELVPDGAHRTITYTHKFSGDESEFHMFKDGINPSNTTFLSILQEV